MIRVTFSLVGLTLGLALLPPRTIAAGRPDAAPNALVSECLRLFDAPPDGFDAVKAAAACKREASGSAEA